MLLLEVGNFPHQLPYCIQKTCLEFNSMLKFYTQCLVVRKMTMRQH